MLSSLGTPVAPFLASLLLAVPAIASVALVPHETLNSPPTGWSFVAPADTSDSIHLEVALTLSNLDQMVEQLYAVSTPGNAAYGQHWSGDQVSQLVQPSDEAVQAAVGWLAESNITSTVMGTGAGASVHFVTTIGQAQTLLNTTFNYYENNGIQALRTTQYSVGQAASPYIDFVHPTTYFGNTKAHGVIGSRTVDNAISKRQNAVDPSCTVGLTPACVRQLYNIPAKYKPDLKAGALIGFGSFLNQSSQESDLLLFEQKYGFKNQTFSVQTIAGGVNDQDETTAQTGEANLDAQNIIGVAHGIPLIEYITGGNAPALPDVNNPTDTNEPYLQYYNYLLAQTNEQLPQVITNSYGDDEETVPRNYATRVCNLIGMMGLRGITVLESSGDTGVGATCRANTGKKLPRFTPQFPGTCPYITAVGGTQNIPEIAWVGSSGGFSDYFARPSYQETALNTYINKHVKPETAVYLSQFANFSGRGFPDVSAMSVSPYYYGFYDAQIERNGGTSAASPVWAGIIGLLNAARLKAGKSAIGFFNPLLYNGAYAAMTDITKGQSIGCNGQDTQTGANVTGAGVIPYAFWNSTVGWDPATGWGVPNFEALLNYTLSV